MEFQQVIKERYSCRKFADRPIEEERLNAILEAGRLAPTAKNLQGQRIYVVRSPEGLAKIDSLTVCRFGAPVVLVVAHDKNELFVYPGGKYDSGVEDAVIVATHMMLAAKDQGIDSCWLNLLDPDVVAQELGLPESEQVVMFLDLGYAAEDAKPAHKHFSRKELAETVKYL